MRLSVVDAITPCEHLHHIPYNPLVARKISQSQAHHMLDISSYGNVKYDQPVDNKNVYSTSSLTRLI